MEYVWDEIKNQMNVEKHGLNFHDEYIVFEGQTVTFIDDRYDYQEIRYVTLGELAGRCVLIVYTPRGTSIRIISMRKANVREKKIFKKRLEESR